MDPGEVLVFAVGSALVLVMLSAALRTTVVPRAEQVFVNRLSFVSLRRLFRLVADRFDDYERQDRILSRYAPVALLTLPAVWAVGIIVGFAAMYWALDVHPLRDAVVVSGSSFTTLGFARAETLPNLTLSIIEALLGLGLVALLISFLPTMYAHFTRREATVAKLYLRASDEQGWASPAMLLMRASRIGGLGQLDELWMEWESWFIDLEESHTTFPALTFFRSPVPERSWITAAGIALDTASIQLSAVDAPQDAKPALMIRSGFIALRRIADFFGVAYDRAPAADDPISVSREEFEAVLDQIATAGVPLVADRDEAWRAFAGWRVNYDTLLVRFAGMLTAPPAPWSSDRAERFDVRIVSRRRR